MRIVSIILAVLVLFLAVQPACGISTVAVSQDACCSAGCSEDSPDKEEDGAEHEDCGVCNPFQSCACCAGYMPMLRLAELPASRELYSAGAKWEQRAIHLFEAPLDAFWQPPRAA